MFRFTIRDVLWLTVVIALICAWSVSHWRTTKRWSAILDASKTQAREYLNKYHNERNYREQLETGTLPPVDLSGLSTSSDPNGITRP